MGLSERKAGDAFETINDYILNGRPPEAQKAIRDFKSENPDLDMTGQDILHKTDVCAGGNPTCISGAGDSGVNRSIGVQNSNQKLSVKEQLDAVPIESTPTVRVKIENNAGD